MMTAQDAARTLIDAMHPLGERMAPEERGPWRAALEQMVGMMPCGPDGKAIMGLSDARIALGFFLHEVAATPSVPGPGNELVEALEREVQDLRARVLGLNYDLAEAVRLRALWQERCEAANAALAPAPDSAQPEEPACPPPNP